MGYRIASERTLEEWSNLDWQDAPGITERAKLGTNSMLAERDLSIECNTGTQPICVINGVWLWYCTVHHQPQSHCTNQRSENELKRMKTQVIEIIKNSESYNIVKEAKK